MLSESTRKSVTSQAGGPTATVCQSSTTTEPAPRASKNRLSRCRSPWASVRGRSYSASAMSASLGRSCEASSPGRPGRCRRSARGRSRPVARIGLATPSGRGRGVRIRSQACARPTSERGTPPARRSRALASSMEQPCKTSPWRPPLRSSSSRTTRLVVSSTAEKYGVGAQRAPDLAIEPRFARAALVVAAHAVRVALAGARDSRRSCRPPPSAASRSATRAGRRARARSRARRGRRRP